MSWMQATGGRYDPVADQWSSTALKDAPWPRYEHTAVWADGELLVWGGLYNNDDTFYLMLPAMGGVYESDVSLDGDGDDVTTCSGDCDDGNGVTYPGAPEVNDGLDNQCSGDRGFGIVDELSGPTGFHTPGDTTEYSWPTQSGATLYEVARSSDPGFAGGCVKAQVTAPSWTDYDEPDSGIAYYYLSRPLAPYTGSWGQDSSGVERTGVCPAP